MQTLLKKALLLAVIAIGVGFSAFAATAPTKGVVRVKLQPEVAAQLGKQTRVRSNGVLKTGASPLDNAVRLVNAVRIEPLLPQNDKYAARRAKYGLDRWYTVTFDQTVSPEEARKIFAATTGVERSETITPMSLKDGNSFRVLDRNAVPKASAAAMPWNDPLMSRQWHYRNFGDIPYSVAGADINLFDAWKTSTGSPDVVVAVIDGGIDTGHEDLQQNLYLNLAELNGEPGKDDDGNGYVDDVYGWNFCTNEARIYPHSHGTHVAGTVAAVNNNGIGVAGVAGGNGDISTGVRMMSCQVFDPRSGAGEGDFAKALVYACENGASIAQCSWGWDAAGYYEQAVLDAIDYFTNEARGPRMTGGLCIFAMGNTGENGDFYPAAYEPCVAVTAMTSELTPAPYSSHGAAADITAPGGLLDYGEAQGVLSTLPNNEYGFNEGTSMATPHVSGVAALILSKYGSPSFTSATLRTQLLSSVNDFYGYGDNSRVQGLFGAGYLDAAKAMIMDQTSAPAAIADFTLNAAQDYVSVQWTLTAGGDSHIIYYSKEPFTAQSDLTALPRKVVDTKFLSEGQQASAELDRLEPLTRYYVAIQAVNRWGQASGLSPVKSVSTNAGPKMTVDEASLSMTSSAGNPVASATLHIGNEAEGILKWQSATRTVSARLQSAARPAPGNVRPFSGTVKTVDARANAAAVTVDYDASDYPAEICDFEYVWAMIGDTDRSKPNSLAQWFTVDATKYPDGFNLTSLWFQGTSEGGNNPVIEIYKGDVAISAASLIQKVDYMFFAYNYAIALPEQLWFAPGESFWVVAHFDGNQEGYPLPMARAMTDGLAGTAYMSNDNGATWSRLSEALKGSSYESNAESFVWGVKARSINPDWSRMLELDPATGSVMPGQKQEVKVSADGSKLVNGDYSLKIRLTSNESGSPVTAVPVTLSVSGNSPDVVVPKVVDFGSLLVGQSKTLTVEVLNKGYGSMRGSQWGAGIYSDNITSSNDNFKGPDAVSGGFPARSKTNVELTFAPLAEGSHSGAIEFKDADGYTVRILVQGSATQPARLKVEPATVDAGTLTAGEDARQLTFSVSNTGKYPLEYVFPAFSDKEVDGAGTLHKFGYTVASTIEGYEAAEYQAPANMIGATDVAAAFTDADYISKAIALPFSFPYYGKSYDQVYITSYGGLMFAYDSDQTLRDPLTPDSYGVKGTGLISAYGSQLMMSPDSHVEYGTADGKFVVNFRNVLAVVYGTDYAPVSFRIVLSPNGDIEMYYDDYTASEFFQSGSTLFCGINDPDCADVLTVTSADMADYWGSQTPTADNTRFAQFNSGTAVAFLAPQTRFVDSLTPAYGLLSPGESAQITATVSVNERMSAGATFNNLAIVTNDPAPEVRAVRFDAVVSDQGLSPAVTVADTDIDFGNVFRTSTQVIPVTVRNTGRNVLNVTAATFTGNSGLTIGTELPVALKAGMALDILVKVPTEKEGAVSDILTVATDAGDVTVAIRGNVIGTPEAVLSLTAIDETVESGTPCSKTLEVANSGNEPLRYSVTGDELARTAVPEKTDTEVSYTYGSSADGKCDFDWVDIVDNGEGEQHAFRYYNEHDWLAVDLPFEFPFYGKKYSRMYIYNTGFVSFTERHDDRIWPEPPAAFPGETLYTNLIAPYWGLHSMNTTRTAGTYHKVSEHQAVVSFMEYGNSMNIGVDFQLILNDDGSFKFQYKGHDQDAQLMGAFGLAGISDENGVEYVRLPKRAIAFGNAVAFTPVRLNTLAPGQKDEVTVTLDTDRMAGTYTTALKVVTNQPDKEQIEIPVSLSVTGEARPVFPAEVVVTRTIGHMETDMTNPIVQMGACYDAAFSVANEGTAPFTVVAVSYESPMIEDEWFGEMPAFMLLGYVDEIDWITGEPTGNRQWQQIDPVGWVPAQVGKEPLRFSVPMMQGEYWMTPGEYSIPVTFVYANSLEDEDYMTATVNVRFVVTPAPLMIFDKEEINIANAADDLVATEVLNMANYGEYNLDYTLELDLTGVGAEDAGEGGGIAPCADAAVLSTVAESAPLTGAEFAGDARKRVRAKADGEQPHVFEAPSDFAYRRALYYNMMPGQTAAYNHGSGTQVDAYKAAVAFKAPADGFNLSHIYLPIVTEGQTNVNVRFEVISGNDPETGELLGTASMMIASQAGGSFYVAALDKALYMNPGEEFCVVACFPEGIRYPAYLCHKEEPVTDGRYLCWTQAYGWADVAQVFKDQYGSLGYIMSCLETEKGEPWVRLVDTPVQGSVEPEGSAEIKVQVNAAAARLEQGNKAMLVIRTNDPSQPVVNFPVILSLNGAPVISAPEKKLFALEGQLTEVQIPVTDPDGDMITVSLNDGDGIATLQGADEDGRLSLTGDGVATVHLTPDYGHNGEHTFGLTAADAAGHSSQAVVVYQVQKVNRAPQTTSEADKITLALDGMSQTINYSHYFTDPDGDELTFAFTVADPTVAEPFLSGSAAILRGAKVGATTATLTATDPEGLTASVEIPVEVVRELGVDDIKSDNSDKLCVLLENPVTESIVLRANASTRATVTVFDMSGAVVAVREIDLSIGQIAKVPFAAANGAYLLQVTADGYATVTERLLRR